MSAIRPNAREPRLQKTAALSFMPKCVHGTDEHRMLPKTERVSTGVGLRIPRRRDDTWKLEPAAAGAAKELMLGLGGLAEPVNLDKPKRGR